MSNCFAELIQKYPRKTFKRTSGEKPEGKLSIFPAKNRRSMDRAIRYMNYLMHKHNQPALPLDKYNYYNDTPPKDRHRKDEPAEEIGWFESLSRGALLFVKCHTAADVQLKRRVPTRLAALHQTFNSFAFE